MIWMDGQAPRLVLAGLSDELMRAYAGLVGGRREGK